MSKTNIQAAILILLVVGFFSVKAYASKIFLHYKTGGVISGEIYDVGFDTITIRDDLKNKNVTIKLNRLDEKTLINIIKDLANRVKAQQKPVAVRPKGAAVPAGGIYANVGGNHWIKKNIDRGTYIVLEDGSTWKVSLVDKIDASLWLPISNIIVVRTNNGLPGYDYDLINKDDGEKVNVKYMGK
tara:strand:- start:119 stop:673 length:555 start_codon:yes stop_codon:yes gene_type:complete